jgi:hypothetical protein
MPTKQSPDAAAERAVPYSSPREKVLTTDRSTNCPDVINYPAASGFSETE